MHDDEKVDWNHFRTALAVARTGNLTNAAKALDINQSTASRHLAALERQVGAVLFLRSRTATELTEAGRVVVARAEEMESAMLNAYDGVGHVAADITGRVRFVAVPWIVQKVVAPRLPEFWRRHPGIEVQAIGDTRERMLDKGEVDLSLRFDTHPHAGVEKVALARVSYSVYAMAGCAPDDLPWLGFREDQLETRVETWLRQASKGQNVRLWANDAGILHEAVRAGAGKALLPDFLAAGDPAVAAVGEVQVQPALWLQVLPDVRRLRRMAVFIAWLKGVFAAAFD